MNPNDYEVVPAPEQSQEGKGSIHMFKLEVTYGSDPNRTGSA
jgi:hypothetical protein